ncbi:MAG TPA: hypothetical protein DGU45_03525 [Planctomycetes bacterium]|nr:hypothetical protein [Planctomycetota bacterium]
MDASMNMIGKNKGDLRSTESCSNNITAVVVRIRSDIPPDQRWEKLPTRIRKSQDPFEWKRLNASGGL